MTLTVGSLFSGIGGMDLGLERAGMSVRWQVECDEYARAVLRKHWPDVPRFGSVELVGAHCLERVDVICGGFPCQDISVAGTGEGLTGARSGLWFQFLRIVREVRPRFVIVENSPRLRSLGLDVVLGGLAESGFDSEWDCLPAVAFGAPHRRDRIFIVAYVADTGRRRVQPLGGARELACATGGDEGEAVHRQRRRRAAGGGGGGGGGGEAVPDADRRRLKELGETHDHDGREPHRNDADGFRPRIFDGRFDDLRTDWGPEPDVGRVADGVPARVDRLRGLGNAVVPAVAEWIGRRVVAFAEGA